MNETVPTHSAPATRRGGRTLGFVAGAAFMCVLSAGVGAGAATLVTSAQIKDGTIVGRDVKNGGLTGADLKDGSVTSKDLKNGTVTSADVKDGSLTGADVQDGSLAAADLATAARSALLQDTIPSGTTVTGIGYFDVQSDISGDFGFSIALPGRAHAPLTAAMVNFPGGTSGIYNDDDSGCTGTKEAPTAPPGEVCLYLIAHSTDISNLRGDSLYNQASDLGFAVRWNDSASSSDTYVSLVWAYTAP
jgi:uncharacterized protein YjbI with pentapeptide repeats